MHGHTPVSKYDGYTKVFHLLFLTRLMLMLIPDIFNSCSTVSAVIIRKGLLCTTIKCHPYSWSSLWNVTLFSTTFMICMAKGKNSILLKQRLIPCKWYYSWMMCSEKAVVSVCVVVPQAQFLRVKKRLLLIVLMTIIEKGSSCNSDQIRTFVTLTAFSSNPSTSLSVS